MPDQSIQATHPIGLDPLLIAQILKGIEIQDQERGLQKLLIGPPPPVPVFSDDQIQFLAPLLAEGLRRRRRISVLAIVSRRHTKVPS